MASSEGHVEMDPIRELLPNGLQMSARQRAAVLRLANLTGRSGPIVLLPDMAFKAKNPFATGLVACFHEHVVPTAIGASINCGTLLMKTDARAADFCGSDWQRILRAIAEKAAEYSRDTPSLTFDEMARAMTDARASCAALGYSKAELDCIEPEGYRLGAETSWRQLAQAIPEFALRGSQLSMGELGVGNHFIEFHSVTDIADREMAVALGVSEGSVTFAIHSSPPLGPLVSLMYSSRPEVKGKIAVKMAIRKALFHLGLPAGMSGLVATLGHRLALHEDEPIARSYVCAYDAATSSGYVHRAMLATQVREILAEKMGIGCELVADLSHNGIWRGRVDGSNVYIHRHGACSFRAAGFFPPDHPYARTGQPAFVGSSMSTPSALFVPGMAADLSYYSLSHGTGKREHPGSPPIDSDKFLHDSGIEALWPAGTQITSQLGHNYRPIDSLAKVLKENGIARMVATMKPVACFKKP
jgi:tRNA-splicing ligase RtcB (3'-phosphate/5'-hydroxy nucleic acid ligase)